jgi:tripartite-type tricarboxylate transporter receptor subunit TctC
MAGDLGARENAARRAHPIQRGGYPHRQSSRDQGARAGPGHGTWFGIFAPGKTPRAIVKQINQAVGAVVELRELKERMMVQGVNLKSSTPDAFSKLVAADIANMSKIVKAAGIKVD